MNQQPRIPDAETRKRHVEKMREVCQQLDALTLNLDELIAIFEADNRRQRRERLAGKYRRVESQVENPAVETASTQTMSASAD